MIRSRGTLSERLLHVLATAPRQVPVWPCPDGFEDMQFSLYILYELSYRGWPGASDGWEWEPSLLRERQKLEISFERWLNQLADEDVPSLSDYLRDEGTLDEFKEFCIHRSIYQLKEADPHTFGIPRLTGIVKSLFVEIQYGEYGEGDPTKMHAELFAQTLRGLGLSDQYHAYLNQVPAITLATTNLISFFGLHRKWRGALIGHLARFEQSSVIPMGNYSQALKRLGVTDSETSEFYDAHVTADAEHERLAGQMVSELLKREPHLAPDVSFGEQMLDRVEQQFRKHLFDSWKAGKSSLSCVTG